MSRPRSGTFRRRHYRSLGPLVSDVRQLVALRGKGTISSAFSERLMLLVTSVNRCRYCASYHAQAAQLSGLTAEEVALLLDGSTQDVPESELPALQYALHWAEAAAKPSPELRQQLVAHYGPDQATAIERMLRMVWIGNLLGNAWDAILFWVSRGRLGE
jgi:AhpD family alkylhydroperoxidase